MIDGWTLGKLLGLDFHDSADCYRTIHAEGVAKQKTLRKRPTKGETPSSATPRTLPRNIERKLLRIERGNPTTIDKWPRSPN